MARIRSIKPEFWTSEAIAQLSRDARLLFIGLWNHADDDGRGLDNTRLIKAAVFPLDDDMTIDVIDRLLGELSSRARCIFYEVSGKRYFQIVGWHHQKIDKRRPSGYPPSSDGVPVRCADEPKPDFTGGATSGRRSVDEASSPDLGILGSRDLGIMGPPKPKASAVRAAPPGFDEFWAIFPRHVAKSAAVKAFEKATNVVGVDTIIEGAKRYRDDPNRSDQFTAHPSTWLNGGRWDDEPMATNGHCDREPAPAVDR
jgi:hypothetical protein